jgi:hypothetical protein
LSTLLRSFLSSLVRRILRICGTTEHKPKTEQNYGGALID